MEVYDFECNICFELANDPIVTPCGHLYCWPCIYKWLYFHSQSNDCPVCKSSIEEQKLVPIYGRGKAISDPRLRPVPGVCIPNRPSGRRAATAPVNTYTQEDIRNHGVGFGFRLRGVLASLMSFEVSNARYGEHYEVDMDRMRRQVHDLLCKTVLLGFGFLILFIFMDVENGLSKS